MKYAFIEANRSNYNIRLMTKVLNVSHGGYYDWREKEVSDRQKFRDRLDGEVRRIFLQHKGRYGAPRITKELRQDGYTVDKKTVANSLKRQKLRAKSARKFKATTNSNHDLPVAPNLLKQDFNASLPNQKWVGDITYLWSDEGWLYLAVIIDLYSRSVIGWSMNDRINKNLVCEALGMALQRRGSPTKVIVHSDRGSQYCSNEYQKMISDNGLLCSMSRRGDCYDNACAESFFDSLKVELTHGVQYEKRSEIREDVFEYIECYYNTIRMHSHNDYVSPRDFEMLKVA